MLAVVKKHHTELFKVSGNIPNNVLDFLESEYVLEIINDEDEKSDTINIRETTWFKNTLKKMNPGAYLKVYRENNKLSQSQLGHLLGNFSRQNISEMERGKRGISKETAKKLASILSAPVDRFL